MVATVVAVLSYLVLGPLVTLVVTSFKSTTGQLPFEGGVPWTLENYQSVLFNTSTYQLLYNTLIFTAGSLCLSFLIGITLAWLVERTDLPLRSWIYVMTVAAIGIPTMISGIAWILLLNPGSGLLNILMRSTMGLGEQGPLNIYSMGGLIFVQALVLVPFTLLLVAAAFRAMDTALEDAASASGAPFRRVMRRITIPLMAPAILGAAVYQFVTAIETFDIPLLIGLRGDVLILSTKIFLEVRPPAGLPDYGAGSTYAVVLLAFALVPLFLSGRIVGRSERFAVITGNTYQPRRLALGRWRYPALGLALGFVLLAFVLPVLMLIWTSLQPFYMVPSAESIRRVSLFAFEWILESALVHKAVLNTVVLGLGTAIGTMALALFVSWILVRSRTRLKPLLDALAFMPHAFPGVIIGLAVMLIYLTLPLPLYGTIWIIIIALITQSVSLATRLTSAGITQVQRQLEEAAEASGANWNQTLRRIVLPLIKPAFLNGFLLIFLVAIKNLTLALMLFTPDTVVLSTLVYNYWGQAKLAEASALSLVMVSITVVLALITRRIGAVES